MEWHNIIDNAFEVTFAVWNLSGSHTRIY